MLRSLLRFASLLLEAIASIFCKAEDALLTTDSLWTFQRRFGVIQSMEVTQPNSMLAKPTPRCEMHSGGRSRLNPPIRSSLGWYGTWTIGHGRRVATILFLAIMLLATSGCVQQHYWYGRNADSLLPRDTVISPPVLIGGPVESMDKMERAIHWPKESIGKIRNGLPSSLSMLRVGQAEETQQDALLAAVQYLEENNLHEVIVEGRHYDPNEQWKRLQANPHIHPIWKYTDGSMRVLAYTMFPSRLYRDDAYNPYTNTLSINSKSRASAVYEAAKAKDFAGAKSPGAYAVARYLPVVPMQQQIKITSDALTYARAKEDWELEKAMYPLTYSQIASSVMAGGATVAPEIGNAPGVATAPVFRAAGNATGYSAGRLVSRSLENRRLATRKSGARAEENRPFDDGSFEDASPEDGALYARTAQARTPRARPQQANSVNTRVDGYTNDEDSSAGPTRLGRVLEDPSVIR